MSISSKTIKYGYKVCLLKYPRDLMESVMRIGCLNLEFIHDSRKKVLRRVLKIYNASFTTWLL